MTHRQRMLRALRGEPVDCLPWVPRLDLWYNAHRYCGTLPDKWREASLLDITADLGVGFHAVTPNFIATDDPDEACDRAIGLDHVKNQPYLLHFNRTRRIVHRDGDRTRVIYKLPQGELSARLRYDEGMRRAGITLAHVEEPVVKSLEDYRLLAALFEDLVIEPDQSRYQGHGRDIGEAGIAVALASVSASPVHHLLKEVVPYDQLYFDLYDHPDIITDVTKAMTPFFEQITAACAQSDAEVVLYGANYDLMVTPPPLFEQHIASWLKQAADTLHAGGKLLLTHTDGENQKLNHFYVECGVDVADSVCPAPMTRLTLADCRRDFGVKPAIWGGLCSISVLPDSMTEEQLESHVDAAIEAAGDGRGIIFSLADTTPPDASLDRLQRIGEKLSQVQLS